MYQEILDDVAARMSKYGERLQPGVTPEQLASLEKRSESELGARLIDGYAPFLKRTNGLDWNGVAIYASERTQIVGYSDRIIDGFMEANLAFRDVDEFARLLVFGESGDELYAYDTHLLQFQIVDRVPLDVLETYSSFERLLYEVIKKKL